MISNKVGASALAGALTSLFVWGSGSLGHPVPAEQASALTVVISALTGWFVKG